MSDTNGLNKGDAQALEQAVAGAVDANNTERAIAAQIQRRGQRLPGDVGQNFGLNGSSLHGAPGLLGPYSNTYPGSRYFSGMFGGYGEGDSLFGLSGGHWHHGIQGSHAYTSRTTSLAHHKMSMCVSAYKGFGVAKNVIDLMANFAAEGLTLKHKNKTVQRFYQRWAKHVDLQGRVKDILRYYYKYGNVFIYTTYGEINSSVYERMKRSVARINRDGSIPGFSPANTTDPQDSERTREAMREINKPLGERDIPWRYTLLNPFQMELRGTKYFGGSRWVFLLDPETASSITSGTIKAGHSRYADFLDETDINLPPEFAKLFNKLNPEAAKGENTAANVVELDQSRLWTMHYMKDDHEDWADPLLWPVMADIFYKNKLREMDISVCNSVINSITVWKLGNLSEGYVASPEHLSKFAEFLRTPSAAMNMVWNDAVDVVQSHPPVEKILNMAKYESVDRDILRGIGIPDTLLGGATSSNFSTGFLGVRTLLERLEEGRNVVLRWLNKQLELVAITMGHRRLPSIKFGKMSLRDEKAEKQLVMGLLDRNVISIQSVLECFGEDYEIELERLREESKIRETDGLLIQHGPYTDPMAELTDEETLSLQHRHALKMARLKGGPGVPRGKRSLEKPDVVRPNGRPPGTGRPQDNQRETKPRGMAWLAKYEARKSEALARINAVEDFVVSTLLKSLGRKNRRALTKKDRDGIEQITFAVASRLDTNFVTLEAIQGVLKTHASMDAEVFVCFSNLKSNEMSIEDKKVAMATAMAMKAMGVNNEG